MLPAIAVSPLVRLIRPVVTSVWSAAVWLAKASITSCSSAEEASISRPASSGPSFVRIVSSFPSVHSFRNMSVKCGSNCFPFPAVISRRIYSRSQAFRYTRLEFIASKASAIATILASSEIPSPFSPFG